MLRRRRWTTAAITVVCALTVLVTPGVALAAPAGTVATVPLGPPLAPEPPAPGTPGKPSLEQVRLEIEDLYHQAVSATDAYNLAKERTERQSAELVKLARQADQGAERLDRLKERAGAAAREQYRGGGLPQGAQFLLTDDPGLFLDSAERVRQGMKATGDLVTELDRAQRELEAYTRQAGTEWRRLDRDRQAQEKAKKEITARIAEARELESSLEEKERERMLALERAAAERAQREWLEATELRQETADGAGDSGSDGRQADGPREGGPGSGAGAEAVDFARAQLGKPYGWGAEGPRAFDCSGLTSKAWAAADVAIPRTSQEQWRKLPRVAVEDMRPGDLIIYHADASHVGMYIGDGQIIHAPRPGRMVSVAGAGSMKILGVVRPSA
ncbi:C40 family peptidase [Streptomyces sp. NPDC000594]|uniref:C40 family peptidase n=1 Tax=Streptomyces sp. NPDC000594 TaxID=3154261 RepID=UPI00331A3FEE